MCLLSVSKKYKHSVKTGYKIFKRTQYPNLYSNIHRFNEFNTGDWYLAKNLDERIYAEDGKTYTAGFHILKNKRAALSYKKRFGYRKPHYAVCKVKYMNVVAEGIDGRACVVAQIMKIVGEVDVA